MAIIDIDVYVPNLATVMGLFDEIQIYRSESGEGGPYEEITADGEDAATLLGTESGPFTLNGLTFKISVDEGDEQTINFVTADPISIDDVVDFLNDATTGIDGATASEESGALRLTSNTTSTSSTLEVTGGTALTELGF